MTNEQLLNAFENAEDLTDEQLAKVAEIEPRYAEMIETLKEEDAIAADEKRSFTPAKA
jgi:hypothetical protein